MQFWYYYVFILQRVERLNSSPREQQKSALNQRVLNRMNSSSIRVALRMYCWPEGKTSPAQSSGAPSAVETVAQSASLPLLVPRVESRSVYSQSSCASGAGDRTHVRRCSRKCHVWRHEWSRKLQQWTLRATSEQRCHSSLEASHAAAQRTHALQVLIDRPPMQQPKKQQSARDRERLLHHTNREPICSHEQLKWDESGVSIEREKKLINMIDVRL